MLLETVINLKKLHEKKNILTKDYLFRQLLFRQSTELGAILYNLLAQFYFFFFQKNRINYFFNLYFHYSSYHFSYTYKQREYIREGEHTYIFYHNYCIIIIIFHYYIPFIIIYIFICDYIWIFSSRYVRKNFLSIRLLYNTTDSKLVN